MEAFNGGSKQDQEKNMSTLISKLAKIQEKLNAPKSQFNNYGGYKYRSCEDILMAVKPLLAGLVIVISDDIVQVGDRIYVKAEAYITDGSEKISSYAFAREQLAKKGMDESQITGAASSYARKYALNGLLLIDDNKDADHGIANEEKGSSKVSLPESSKSVAKYDYDSLPDEHKAIANSVANCVIDAYSNSGIKEAFDVYEAAKFDYHGNVEMLAAIWGKIPSEVRSAIKKHGKIGV